ncbi:hypothetical protein H6P81_006303 [Aristolochia fimbriata]|uniref:Retrovirus-related Pol polyprotein from transposon TNT 1-94-like beta-barrel domain-containing protein n=1 Tax=Aristolochia fimbriata TaxID=158543 RepID=A0AAV7EYB7_ARIFI|nr:hypothetical protein H6P81_006303 [Aristolochia fimbriata]
MTMVVYIAKVKSIVDDLAAANQPLDDQTVTHYVIIGLCPDFELFAQTATAREHRLQVIQQLNSPDVSGRPSTNVAARGGRGSSNRGRGRQGSWGGGRSSSSCRGQGRGQHDHAKCFNHPQCQICHKRRHVALQCYQRFNLTYQQTPPPQANTTSLDPTHDFAWYTDSGASHHIASNVSFLTYATPYTVLQNGAGLPISFVGSHKINSFISLRDVLCVPSSVKNLLSVSKLTKDRNCVMMVFVWKIPSQSELFSRGGIGTVSTSSITLHPHIV